MKKHDFAELGEQLVASLKQAANDQVNEANNLLASVTALAEDINANVSEHAKLLDDMDGRLRLFGESVLEAHKKFLNGQKHENPSP
jgi:type II secretory pathway predicted ATPase ExeA